MVSMLPVSHNCSGRPPIAIFMRLGFLCPPCLCKKNGMSLSQCCPWPLLASVSWRVLSGYVRLIHIHPLSILSESASLHLSSCLCVTLHEKTWIYIMCNIGNVLPGPMLCSGANQLGTGPHFVCKRTYGRLQPSQFYSPVCSGHCTCCASWCV